MGRRINLKQQYVPYWKWECYKSGMWSRVSKQDESGMLEKAIEFTGNHDAYGEAMRDVVFKWKNSMLNFLTNKSINRKAYVGHCAVFYKLQIPEYIVRMAWKKLSENQRILANIEAEKTIKIWEAIQLERSISMLESGKDDAIKTGFQMKLQLN